MYWLADHGPVLPHDVSVQVATWTSYRWLLSAGGKSQVISTYPCLAPAATVRPVGASSAFTAGISTGPWWWCFRVLVQTWVSLRLTYLPYVVNIRITPILLDFLATDNYQTPYSVGGYMLCHETAEKRLETLSCTRPTTLDSARFGDSPVALTEANSSAGRPSQDPQFPRPHPVPSLRSAGES